MRSSFEQGSLPMRFFRSCRRYKIPESVARKIAETFREEYSYYPRTYGEALLKGCE